LGEIRDKTKRKSKFRGQLRAKLKKLGTKDLSTKNTQIQGINSIENMVEIEQIKSLEVN
jgi:hypothetical protein